MLIIILVAASTAMAFGSLVVVALAHTAARADDELHDLLARRLGASAMRVQRDSYAGLAFAQATISPEPSIAVPSSSSSVGTQRLPVSSCTSRRPRVRLSAAGRGAKP
jgi:hypothetical protein